MEDINVEDIKQLYSLYSQMGLIETLKTLKKRGIIKIESLKTPGPGGQRKNKSETGIRITHFPTKIQVMGDERSQYKSKKAALGTLLERLEEYYRPQKERIPTTVPFSVELRRRKEKRLRKEKKDRRRKPIF